MYGTVQKLRNTTLIFLIYFLNINICYKKQTLIYTSDKIHSIHIRFKTNFHPPTANLTKFQKAVYYSAIKILTTFLTISKTQLMRQYCLECFKEGFAYEFLLQ